MNVIIGFIAGIAASMGFGGGFILIVYLTLFGEADQAEAQGINLLFFLPIALISIIIHHKNKLIEWKILPMLALSGAVGVFIGSSLANVISTDLLQKFFAALLIYVGMKEIFHKEGKNLPKVIDKKEIV